MAWCTLCKISRRSSLAPNAGGAARDLRANTSRSSFVYSSDPTAPSEAVGMNARTAVKAVRTLQLGCQCSGWCCVIDKQIFSFTTNRPEWVSNTNEGGLNGYSGGSNTRPW